MGGEILGEIFLVVVVGYDKGIICEVIEKKCYTKNSCVVLWFSSEIWCFNAIWLKIENLIVMYLLYFELAMVVKIVWVDKKINLNINEL